MSVRSRLQGLIDQLQGTSRSYKKHIEEAEEMATLNLAKFKQTQNALSVSYEAAEANEHALAKSKTRAGSSSTSPVSNLLITCNNMHMI